jgi:hypothetical protein
LLDAALSGFQSANMQLHAAVARRRLGQLRSDAQGQELVREAEKWMSGQTIRDTQRMAALLAPGWNS